MNWYLTDDVEEYADRAWDLLASDPEASTIGLTIIEAVREGVSYGEVAPTYGWLELEDGTVAGAVSITPPWPLLLSITPEESLAHLAHSLRTARVEITEVNGTTTSVTAFANVWADGHPLAADEVMRTRLYRLGTLVVPERAPGRARVADENDIELVIAWLAAFADEASDGHSHDREEMARRLMASGRLSLWELDGGEIVSMAGRRSPAVGVVRVGPVYTPPAHRRNGYGAAVTAACSQAALDEGASSVVLFTDLANPISNSIYQAIGYVPLSDRVIVRFVGDH